MQKTTKQCETRRLPLRVAKGELATKPVPPPYKALPAPVEPLNGCSASELVNLHRSSVKLAPLGQGLSVKVFTIHDATIIGDRNPLVFAPSNSSSVAVWESHLIRPNFDWELNNNLKSDAWSGNAKTTTLNTPVLFLAGPGSDNFYHWMHDCVPRLIAAQRAGIDAPILIPSYNGKNRFIRESLSLLGISEDKLIEHPGGKVFAPAVILVEDLFQDDTDKAHLQLLNEVRERLLKAAGVTSGNRATGRIFLSREGTGTTRTLTNQTEVECLLGKNGFQKVQLERLSLTDQVRLLANASEVVAPHGAGLVHTLFMAKGNIVGIRSPSPMVSGIRNLCLKRPIIFPTMWQ